MGLRFLGDVIQDSSLEKRPARMPRARSWELRDWVMERLGGPAAYRRAPELKPEFAAERAMDE